MSGRGEGRGGALTHGWLRGALVVVVIGGVLGVFGTQTRLQRPRLSALNIAGIVAMAVGLAIALLARSIAGKMSKENGNPEPFVKLAGVLLCGVGAALVFL